MLGRVQRMEQGSPRAVPQVVQTNDTNCDKTDASELRRRVRSKRTYTKEEVLLGRYELCRSFVTEATDATRKSNHF